MRRSIWRRAISTIVAGAVTTTLLVAVPQSHALADDNDTVSAGEVAAVLNNTDSRSDGLIAEPVPTATDADDAAVAKLDDGSVVEVSRDPEDGVAMKAEGEPTVTVELPNAAEAGNAKRLEDGTVVYPGTDGTANSVAVAAEGTQMTVTIANREANNRFDYTPSVAGGGTVKLTDDGGAVVLDAEENILKVVPPAWGKDAKGVAVPTTFETDGTRLTMVVNHTGGDYAYPIVADPWWLGAIAAAVGWCAVSSAQDLIWAGGKAAIRRGDWNWNQRIWSAADSCLSGLVFGPFSWAVPWFMRRWAVNALKPYVYTIIRLTVLRR